MLATSVVAFELLMMMSVIMMMMMTPTVVVVVVVVALSYCWQSSSLQSWHGDHFKETGGPCCQRWAFYNVRLRHWPSTRTKKELKNQKNGLQLPRGTGGGWGDKGAGLAEIAKRSTRKAGGKWPKLALSKSDNNHAWVLTLTHILPHTHSHTYCHTHIQ